MTALGSSSIFGLTPSAPGASSGPPAHPSSTADCPGCGSRLSPQATPTGWQDCPFCQKRVQIRLWPVARNVTKAADALPEQATCFFHPDKAFQACCQRCGRFVCALCDLQLGAEHLCPTCFERGRAKSGPGAGGSEWRHRDVLYDSIAVALGWGWILISPFVFLALPAVIVLHVKYGRAPRSYLIPRSGWRFWMAYAGFAWLPLLVTSLIWIPRWIAMARGQ